MFVSGTSHAHFITPRTLSAPILSGSAQVGVVKTYTPGSYSNPNAVIVRQWLLDGNPISGATGTTYTPVAGDEGGSRLSIRETATLTGSPMVNTSNIVSVNRLPTFSSPPTLQGTPTVGQSITYTQGSVFAFPGGSITQQWKLDGAAITGATGPNYVPASSDAGHTLTVTETYTNSVGSASSTSTGATVDQLPFFTSSPAVNGTPTVGIAIGYVQGATGGVPAPAITQQWVRNGVDIAGATAATYTPVSGDTGANLAVRQIATNVVGSANSTSSSVVVAGGGAGLVTWDPVAGATGYNVYWDTMGGPPYTNSSNVGNVTTFTPPSLVSGTTYYFNVRAYDATGLEGTWGTQLQKAAP